MTAGGSLFFCVSGFNAMTELTHAGRRRFFDRERTYTLGDNALTWQAGEAPQSLRYDAIGEVRLLKYGFGQGQLSIRDRDGNTMKLRSHHRRGWGSLENRAQTYVPFVRELCRRVAGANPKAKFIAGSTVFWFFWMAVVLICGVNALLFTIPLFYGAFAYLIPLLASLAVAVVMWCAMPSIREAAFDPADPPAEALDF